MPRPSSDPSLSLTAALSAHLARHNWQVFGLTLLSAASAALLWSALYLFAYWLTLFGLTVANGADAAMPRSFSFIFFAIASGLVLAAWLDHWVAPNRLPPDKKSPWAIALDFLLATPRATLAVWGNLSAWQRLTRWQLELAADLLAQLMRQRRIAVHALPLEIPDDRARERIVFAMLVVGIVELQREAGLTYLRLARRGQRLLLRVGE